MAKEKIDIELLKLVEQEVHTVDEKVTWIAAYLQQLKTPTPPAVEPPPEPLTETPVQSATPSKLPAWAKEKLEQEKVIAKPKAKFVNKRLITLGIVAVALIVLSLFLRSQGWTCAVPGM